MKLTERQMSLIWLVITCMVPSWIFTVNSTSFLVYSTKGVVRNYRYWIPGFERYSTTNRRQYCWRPFCGCTWGEVSRAGEPARNGKVFSNWTNQRCGRKPTLNSRNTSWWAASLAQTSRSSGRSSALHCKCQSKPHCISELSCDTDLLRQQQQKKRER